MKNKIHVMTDIETLGKKEGSTIFQIAATSFNIEDGSVQDSIDLKLDIEKVEGLSVDGNTLKWWLNTDKELLTQLLNDGELSELDMFTKFNEWILKQGDESKVTLWGNGIIFDNVKLKLKLEELKMEYPIFYKNDRDVRTILALASDKSGLSEKEIKSKVECENEVAHDALDDVSYQIRLVCYCYELLMK